MQDLSNARRRRAASRVAPAAGPALSQDGFVDVPVPRRKAAYPNSYAAPEDFPADQGREVSFSHGAALSPTFSAAPLDGADAERAFNDQVDIS